MSRIIATFVTALLLALAPAAAMAGPTPRQPADQKISRASAHELAVVGQHEFFTHLFAGPVRHVVSRCVAGPYVWRCPAVTTASDARCTMVLWVWADKTGSAYVEHHLLRCTAPQ